MAGYERMIIEGPTSRRPLTLQPGIDRFHLDLLTQISLAILIPFNQPGIVLGGSCCAFQRVRTSSSTNSNLERWVCGDTGTGTGLLV